MFHLENTPGRTTIVNGKEHLFFSGYSYLGMQYVPEFVELVKEGIDKYGWLFPSSRISNTQLDLFAEFENKLSGITNKEESVCFSSGFTAGRAVIELLKHKTYSCAPQTHPAICLTKSNYSSFDEWQKNIGNEEVICFDGVNPLTATINNVSFLDNITSRTCVIDDSHGIGVINEGKGTSNYLSPGHQHILTYSLSKAYNLIGGAVSCSKVFAKQLRSSPYYTASTSIAPAFAYAFINGQHLYEQQRKKLTNNISFFTEMMKDHTAYKSDLPIFVLPASINEEKLQDEKIIISSFAYPDPKGKKINRAVLSALHTEEDLEKLASVLKKLGN